MEDNSNKTMIKCTSNIIIINLSHDTDITSDAYVKRARGHSNL
jgi:hypothetical protein